MIRKRTVGRVIALFLLASIMAAAFSLVAVSASAKENKYDPAGWRDVNDTAIVPDEDGTISVDAVYIEESPKFSLTGAYYTGNIADSDMLERTGTLTVAFEYSFSDPAVSFHFIPVISNRSIEKWVGDMTAGDREYVGNSSHLLGARMYFQNEDQIKNNRMLIRVCDYANYQTANYFNNVNTQVPVKHTLQFNIAEDGVTMQFDEQMLTKDDSPYYLQKAAGVRWTLADFLDGDGTPGVWFGFMNAGFGNITVHRLAGGDGLVSVGNFEGKETALSEQDGAVLITDGSAYAKTAYQNTDWISGMFTVENIPAYVYDGISEGDRDSVAKTWFRVNFKDSVTDGLSGNGFRITWSPLESGGSEKTELEFGYIDGGVYTALSSFLIGTPMPGSHYFAIIPVTGGYKLMADGESVYAEIAADNGLYSMENNMIKDNMRLYYSADDGYNQSYPGKWEVKLSDAALTESPGAYFSVGNAEIGVSGDCREETVEQDGRTYQIIAENESLSVSGKENSPVPSAMIFGNNPIKLFSRLALSLEMTLKVTEIPAYTTDGKDAYIGVFFSAVPGGTTGITGQSATFAALFRWKSASEISVLCKMGADSAEYTAKVDSSEIKILFGWYGDESQIRIDGQVAMSGSLSKGNFNTAEGLLGYFAVSTYSEADDWSFSISAPRHVELKAPVETPDEKPGEKPENPETSGCDCASSLSGTFGGGILLLLSGVAFVMKKRRG